MMADIEAIGKFLGWATVGAHYIAIIGTFAYPFFLVNLLEPLYPDFSKMYFSMFFWISIIVAVLNLGYFKVIKRQEEE